jgi:hypothetical protein
MKTKKLLQIGFFLFLGGLFLLVSKILWNKYSANPSAGRYFTNKASVNFQDGSGKMLSFTSNTVTIEETDLVSIKSFLKNRHFYHRPVAGIVEIIDPQTNQYMGKITISLNNEGKFIPDWTTLPNMEKNHRYDIIITFPGYLSKRVRDVILSEDKAIDSGIFLAGDINGDNLIDLTDFNLWKQVQGQKGELIADFNDDGSVDEKDFALSFGSDNFGQKGQR